MVKVEVKINGKTYNLVGRENEEYLLKLGTYVDDKINEVKTKNNRLNNEEASALVALNIADELYKADKNYINLNKEAKENELKLEETKKSLDEYIKKYQELEKKVDEDKNKYENIISRNEINLEETKRSLDRYIKKCQELEKKADEDKKKYEKLEKETTLKLKQTQDELQKSKDEIKRVKLENEILKSKNEELKSKSEELANKNEELKKNIAQNIVGKKDENRELKTAKYKNLDLENKLMEAQVEIAKLKKHKNPLIRE